MRVFIRESLVRRLVADGVSDDVSSLTRAINDILEYSLTAHQTELITLTDLVAIEQSLSDRIEELTATNIALAKLLYDLGAVVEVDRIFSTFHKIAKARMPAEVRNSIQAASQPAGPPSTSAKAADNSSKP